MEDYAIAVLVGELALALLVWIWLLCVRVQSACWVGYSELGSAAVGAGFRVAPCSESDRTTCRFHAGNASLDASGGILPGLAVRSAKSPSAFTRSRHFSRRPRPPFKARLFAAGW